MRLKTFFLTLLLIPLLDACLPQAVMLATGGIGGTGISTGMITAFGSVFVNGVEYDTSAATFTRDGAPAFTGQTEYHVGEYVTVNGKVNPDGITGTATGLVFNNDLEGPVTVASTDGVSLEIMGQTIHTNALTVFNGFNSLTGLKVNDPIEVSGARGVNGDITASSLTLKPGSTMLEVYGTAKVDPLKQPFRFVIGNVTDKPPKYLTVDYSGAALVGDMPANWQEGYYLEVKSLQPLQDLPSGGKLMMASEVTLKQQYQKFGEGDDVETEGMITCFKFSICFTVNGQSVTTTAQTKFEGGTASDLSENALVEVDGKVTQGILVASEVSIKQSARQPILERKGKVDSIDATTNTFTLVGHPNETVTINSTTLWLDERGIPYSFKPDITQLLGVKVEVKAKQGSGTLLALRVKLEDD